MKPPDRHGNVFPATLMENRWKITHVGEESLAHGPATSGEKDGLWAVHVLAHHILAKRGLPVEEIVLRYWAEYGRNVYSRHDYEGLQADCRQRLDGSPQGASLNNCQASASAAIR